MKLNVVARVRHWRRRPCNSERDRAYPPVQTHLRTERIVGSGVDVKDVFHVPDEVATRRTRQAPVFFQPGLEIVFFSVRRTVSYDTASTMSNSTALSASRRSVQRLRPSGGGLPGANQVSCQVPTAPGKLSDLMMLVGQRGQKRTVAEYEDVLARADFRLARIASTASA